jgi:hypothetical protein
LPFLKKKSLTKLHFRPKKWYSYPFEKISYKLTNKPKSTKIANIAKKPNLKKVKKGLKQLKMDPNSSFEQFFSLMNLLSAQDFPNYQVFLSPWLKNAHTLSPEKGRPPTLYTHPKKHPPLNRTIPQSHPTTVIIILF